MLHFDTSFIMDFRLESRTKSPDLENPTTFRNYVSQTINARYWEHRSEAAREAPANRAPSNVTVVTPSRLRYSCYSGNVPGLHIILQVELLTLFTSRLPFLLCSSFVSTLLIRKHRLVVLLFCSIVLCSQTYLRSETPDSLLCSNSGYWACCAP